MARTRSDPHLAPRPVLACVNAPRPGIFLVELPRGLVLVLHPADRRHHCHDCQPYRRAPDKTDSRSGADGNRRSFVAETVRVRRGQWSVATDMPVPAAGAGPRPGTL